MSKHGQLKQILQSKHHETFHHRFKVQVICTTTTTLLQIMFYILSVNLSETHTKHLSQYAYFIFLLGLRPLQITATSKQRHQQQLFTQAQHKSISLDTLNGFLYTRNLHLITKDLVSRDSCSKNLK